MKQCRKNKNCLYRLIGMICPACKAAQCRESNKIETDVKPLSDKTMQDLEIPRFIRNQKMNLYIDTYLTSRNAVTRERKPINVSPDLHQKITRIVQLLPDKKITMSEYLCNIIQKHMEMHSQEIVDLYHNTNKPIL